MLNFRSTIKFCGFIVRFINWHDCSVEHNRVPTDTFPAIKEDADIEEERRVAYVAFTRAKEKIYLTYATRRLIYGRLVRNGKSRFLTEYISNPEINEHIDSEKKKNSENLGEIHVGEHIYHSNFGSGIVIAVDDLIAQILFEKDNSLRKIMKTHPAIIRGGEEE